MSGLCTIYLKVKQLIILYLSILYYDYYQHAKHRVMLRITYVMWNEGAIDASCIISMYPSTIDFI